MRHHNANVNRANEPLTNDHLAKYAPSIFATQPWHEMSPRYTFIPTIDIVAKMRSEGFLPYSAVQSRTRTEGKQEFTRHMIRFRDTRRGDAPAIRHLGEISPELVLTNAHDGASAFMLDAGLFRLVCLNGLVVSQGEFSQIKARHSGSAEGIIEASYEVISQFPKVLESVEQFSRLRLTAPQQVAFAHAALELRYDDPYAAPATPAQLIQPRRSEDTAPTLWNTFNTVQENLVNGGLRGQNPETGRRTRIRAITGIGENVRLNKALWTLAEEMRKLAA